MTYFLYTADGDYEEFETEEAAVASAQSAIVDCRGEEWFDAADSLVVGKITHRSVQTNVVTREMLDDEGDYNGLHYSGPYDEWSDYELQRVDDARDLQGEVARLTVERDALRATLARIRSLCQPHASPASNTGAHRLAWEVLKSLDQQEPTR